VKITAKLGFDKFQRMKLKLGENTELQKYTVLSLTSDEKG
jgi:hypothetical protein